MEVAFHRNLQAHVRIVVRKDRGARSHLASKESTSLVQKRRSHMAHYPRGKRRLRVLHRLTYPTFTR
jgi:hypothetical protein